VRKGGFAKAGMAVQEYVVKGRAPVAGSGDEQTQVFPDLCLANVLIKRDRPGSAI